MYNTLKINLTDDRGHTSCNLPYFVDDLKEFINFEKVNFDGVQLVCVHAYDNGIKEIMSYSGYSVNRGLFF